MDFPLVDIHTHLPEDTSVVSLYAYDPTGEERSLPQRPYSTGIHPWTAQRLDEYQPWLQRFQESISSQTVAVGEIGLDFHTARTDSERLNQQHWFHRQAQEAAERRLPLIIHCVKAWEELLNTLTQWPQLPILIHGFNGSPQLAERLLAAGCFLSFGSGIFRSPKARAALKLTPLDRLFLETDAQTLFSIKTIYERAAEELELPTDHLQELLYTNYQRFFNLRLSL